MAIADILFCAGSALLLAVGLGIGCIFACALAMTIMAFAIMGVHIAMAAWDWLVQKWGR